MQGDKYVILYVEDDPDFRSVMRTALEANGYVYIEASSGEEGLQQFKAHKPDLLILDVMMEEVDTGTSMIADLRAAGCKAPILVASSLGDALQSSIDYSELGIAGVLQKPVNFDELLKLVQSKLN